MNILDKFNALRVDLQKHLGVGLAIAYVTAVLCGVLGWYFGVAFLAHPVVAGIVGFAVGVAAGWLKEYKWDASGKGVVDRDDYLFTGRGAVIGAILGGITVAILFA